MVRQILESIDSFAPDAVIFGLDDRSGSIRDDLYPDYKAGRAEKDAALVDQPDRAAALLDALGLATLTPPGLEQTTSTPPVPPGRGSGWNCVIITSDRDAFAHISDHTRVLRLINGGINGSPTLNPARLFTMYGVAAGQLPRVRRPAGRRQRQPARRAGHRREDRRDPARRRRLDGHRVEGHRPQRRHALLGALDDWSAETGGRRVGATVVRRLSPRVPASATSSTCR